MSILTASWCQKHQETVFKNFQKISTSQVIEPLCNLSNFWQRFSFEAVSLHLMITLFKTLQFFNKYFTSPSSSFWPSNFLISIFLTCRSKQWGIFGCSIHPNSSKWQLNFCSQRNKQISETTNWVPFASKVHHILTFSKTNSSKLGKLLRIIGSRRHPNSSTFTSKQVTFGNFGKTSL